MTALANTQVLIYILAHTLNARFMDFCMYYWTFVHIHTQKEAREPIYLYEPGNDFPPFGGDFPPGPGGRGRGGFRYFALGIVLHI